MWCKCLQMYVSICIGLLRLKHVSQLWTLAVHHNKVLYSYTLILHCRGDNCHTVWHRICDMTVIKLLWCAFIWPSPRLHSSSLNRRRASQNDGVVERRRCWECSAVWNLTLPRRVSGVSGVLGMLAGMLRALRRLALNERGVSVSTGNVPPESRAAFTITHRLKKQMREWTESSQADGRSAVRQHLMYCTVISRDPHTLLTLPALHDNDWPLWKVL